MKVTTSAALLTILLIVSTQPGFSRHHDIPVHSTPILDNYQAVCSGQSGDQGNVFLTTIPGQGTVVELSSTGMALTSASVVGLTDQVIFQNRIQFTATFSNTFSKFFDVIVTYTPHGFHTTPVTKTFNLTTLKSSATNVYYIDSTQIPAGSTINGLTFVNHPNGQFYQTYMDFISNLMIDTTAVGLDATDSATCSTP